MSRYYDDWPRYVPVAERRRRAAKKVAKMKQSGREVAPVEIAGRKIATTFWGEAWCNNLEAYSDYTNRLPRGRTYVRNGSVIDLQIEAGRVRALVSGSDLYTVDIEIKPLAKPRWKAIKDQCSGQIGSLVELLRGSISKGVMEIVTRQGEGLFPPPREIKLGCSCPDWATMCKHVAAVLYGIGARLDHAPELLFTLRGVDPTDMVEAAVAQPTGTGKARKARVLETDELSSVFGVDIDMEGMSSDQGSTKEQEEKHPSRATRTRKKPATAIQKKKTAPRSVSKATKTPAAKKKTAKKSVAAKRTGTRVTKKKVTSKKGTGTRTGKARGT